MQAAARRAVFLDRARFRRQLQRRLDAEYPMQDRAAAPRGEAWRECRSSGMWCATRARRPLRFSLAREASASSRSATGCSAIRRRRPVQLQHFRHSRDVPRRVASRFDIDGLPAAEVLRDRRRRPPGGATESSRRAGAMSRAPRGRRCSSPHSTRRADAFDCQSALRVPAWVRCGPLANAPSTSSSCSDTCTSTPRCGASAIHWSSLTTPTPPASRLPSEKLGTLASFDEQDVWSRELH